MRAADGEEGGGQKASRQVYCTGFRVATEAQIREFFSPAGGVVAMCNKVCWVAPHFAPPFRMSPRTAERRVHSRVLLLCRCVVQY